jgi:sugar phosphate isomerase/epimerase
MRFGVKAAVGDARVMADLDIDLLEVHMEAEDLPKRRDLLLSTFRTIREETGHDLVVHAPEFMMTGAGPSLVDLASPDADLRSLSRTALEATIELARDLGAFLLVIHPGGISPPADEGDPSSALDALVDGLDHLRDRASEAGTLLTVENMPWFYHHAPLEGGEVQRWESSILVMPDDMDVLAPHVDGMTLDVSHGYLHDPRGGMEAIEGFIERHLPRILHLHLSDAMAPDHEGLQVGEGHVDFEYVLERFRGRQVTAVPEIMGGHRGGGLSFQRALKELRNIESCIA